MKKKILKTIAVFALALSLIFSNYGGIVTFGVMEYAYAGADENADILFGTEQVCSEGTITAVLSLNGDSETYTLTIKGQGKMQDFAANMIPWKDYSQKVTSVIISEGVTYIGARAFSGMPLTNLTIPANVERIGTEAARSAEAVTILGMKTTFGNGFKMYPFKRGATVTCFEGSTAEECFEKEKGMFKPGKITTIPCYLYDDEEKTTTTKYQATDTDITIPDNVVTIGEETFKNNQRLTSVNLNHVKVIKKNAFAGCTNLKSMIITPKVETIEENALPADIIIYGKNNTAAQTYAQTNNLKFINLLPVLREGVSSAVDKTITNVSKDTINLHEVFTNAYESDMTFLVAEGNNPAQALDGSNYTFACDKNGEYTLVFSAKDSVGDISEQTYTVNYTVRSNNAPIIKTDVKVDKPALVVKESATFDLTDIFEDADGDPLKYYVSVNDETPTEIKSPYTNKYGYTSASRPMKLEFTANDSFASSEEYTVEAQVYDFCLTPVAGADINDVGDANCVLTETDSASIIEGKKIGDAYYYDLKKNQKYTYEVSLNGCVTMKETFTYDGNGKREEVKLSKTNHRLPTSVVDIHAVKGYAAYDPSTGTAEENERGWNAVLTDTTAWNKYTGLGGFGGYMTVYYEDGIVDNPTNPYGIDFIVYGNAFAYGNNSGGEPAGVKVSEDGSTWYELAGSAHYEVSTKYKQNVTTLDGTQSNSTLIAKTGEYQITNVVPEALSVFGYADVHKCSAAQNAEGEYHVTGIAGNPYSSTHKENVGDGFDLKWAVDENGTPVDVSGKSFHYIRMQNVVDINHPTFNTNSPEIGTLNRAVASKDVVGITSAPKSIKIQGKEYISEQESKTLDYGSTKYYEINLDDTRLNALDVEIIGNKGDNIYVNKERFDENANYKGLLKDDGSRIIRVIVQNGEKEPLIYVFSLTGGGNPSKNADLDNMILTPGDVLIKSPTITSDNSFSVANNVTKIALQANALNPNAKIEIYKDKEIDAIELESGKVSELLSINVGRNDFKLKVTSADGSVSNTYAIVVNRVSTTDSEKNSIKVSFTFTGDIIHYNSSTGQSTGNHSADIWIKTTDVTIPKNVTVKYITDLMLYNNGIEFDATDGTYISKVKIPNTNTWLGEFDNGQNSGWMYRLNGLIANEGYATRVLKNGDTILWFYTDDYKKETGYEGGWDIVNGGGTVEEVKNVTTDTKTGTTTAPTDVKVSEKTNADGTKTKIADVKVSADNQKEILKQAKEKKSNEIILLVSSKSVGDATKADVTLEKSFIDSIVKDTDAKLTIKTPFGDKTYTQEELKALSAGATGSTIAITVEKAEKPIDDNAAKVEKAKALTKEMKLIVRSTKTAKKNIKITVKTNSKTTAAIKELKNLGYTVKYRFYRSTKKTAGYKAAVTKKTASYTNTGGKKGTKYYYKVQVRVYDADGKLAAKTALKQCKYASRTWTKGK